MVHRFTLDEGTYISSTGKQGSQNGQFDRPNGLCVAPDGSLYVCDSENHRIQVFDRDLNFLHTFGAVGMDRGEFNWPSNVAITSDGNVYVTELNNHRIQCLSRSGDHVRFIGRPGYGETELGRPNILHIHDSHIFVSDDRGVVVFTLSGQFVTRFANELSKVGDYPIEGLTVSSDGFVYVYGCSRNEIFIY
jgi:tripartite motif-containing protein 2/3/tripartite motif-containing protein 71